MKNIAAGGSRHPCSFEDKTAWATRAFAFLIAKPKFVAGRQVSFITFLLEVLSIVLSRGKAGKKKNCRACQNHCQFSSHAHLIPPKSMLINIQHILNHEGCQWYSGKIGTVTVKLE